MTRRKKEADCYYTIEFQHDLQEFAVYEHGEYPEYSVLAGQYRRHVMDYFKTVEEALEAYPEAEVLDHSTKCSIPMSNVPWDGFDEGDAGERWDEDY